MDGRLVFDEWCDMITIATYDIYIVTKNGKKNIWDNGDLVSEKWVDDIQFNNWEVYVQDEGYEGEMGYFDWKYMKYGKV